MAISRGTAAAVAAFFVFPALVGAQDGPRATGPVIVTAGQGEVKVAPDRATVRVGVQSRAATAALATADNSRRQKAVIDGIKRRGVPANQITTLGFSVQPEVQADRSGQGQAKVVGYVVSNTVSFEVSQLELLGPILDQAIDAGATNISGLDFRIANQDSARRAALALAVAKAKGDAEVVARAAGGSLGQLIELLATEYSYPGPRPYDNIMVTAVGSARAAAPIEAGLETVSASVTIRWQFIPGAPR